MWVTPAGEIVTTAVEIFARVGEAEAVTVTVCGVTFAVLNMVTMEGVAVAVAVDLTGDKWGASGSCD